MKSIGCQGSSNQCYEMVKFGRSKITKPNRYSKPVFSPALAARKALLQRIHRRELRKLQALLPLSRRCRSEASIVEEAARYIDQLHATILARVHSGTLSYETVANRLHPFALENIQRCLIVSQFAFDGQSGSIDNLQRSSKQ